MGEIESCEANWQFRQPQQLRGSLGVPRGSPRQQSATGAWGREGILAGCVESPGLAESQSAGGGERRMRKF